ncbi:MAG: dihydroxy-acid dehydratase, partial [Proteobacteria bacterium]|nr:dihydroxy-acid dehydratase [Pseudomonadota bacterium]
SLVQEGDSIFIDVPNRTLTLEVEEDEMARRKDKWSPPALKVKDGYLYRYAKMVTSASTGAILKI